MSWGLGTFCDVCAGSTDGGAGEGGDSRLFWGLPLHSSYPALCSRTG